MLMWLLSAILLTIKLLSQLSAKCYDTSKESKFSEHINKGIALFNSSKFEEALKQFQQASRINKNNTASRKWIAATYEHWERFDKAVEGYKELIKMDPADRGLHSHLAILYRLMSEREEQAAAESKIELDSVPSPATPKPDSAD